MFRVSITSLVLLLLSCSLGPVLVCWALSAWKARRRERASERVLRRCALCFFEFVPAETTAAPCACPRCSAPTEARPVFRI